MTSSSYCSPCYWISCFFFVLTIKNCFHVLAASKTKSQASDKKRAVQVRFVIWIPICFANIKGAIRGFHFRVSWPKWTPTSIISSKVIFQYLFVIYPHTFFFLKKVKKKNETRYPEIAINNCSHGTFSFIDDWPLIYNQVIHFFSSIFSSILYFCGIIWNEKNQIIFCDGTKDFEFVLRIILFFSR